MESSQAKKEKKVKARFKIKKKNKTNRWKAQGSR